ncbi:phosphoglycerate mutase-like protein [Auriculariales sp. MPI-PUGE-AT-0066]|nr:phosphoglycerate mutase-like protein [Auriculariales sp. MPI-PUGE-AT-0066]
MSSAFSYTLVPGFFSQDEPSHVPSTQQIAPRFGLIGEEWPDIAALNAGAPVGTSYKLIFAGRHGQGFHNVGELKYGTEAWDSHWSLANGDGELIWGPDPLLTDTGINQAKHAASHWMLYQGPQPTLYLCSPLRRTLRTFSISFDGTGAVARVIENVREHLTGHTCDVRMNVSELKDFATTIEGGGAVFDWSAFGKVEEDPHANELETHDDVKTRAKVVLDEIFGNKDAQIVSITTHSNFISNLSELLGRNNSVLPTGGVAPFLIKAVAAPAS